MKIIKEIITELVIACTTVLCAYAEETAPQGGSEQLSVTDLTRTNRIERPESLQENGSTNITAVAEQAEEIPIVYKAPQFLQTPVFSNDWKITTPATAESDAVALQESDSAPLLFANAKGNERFFWLKPPEIRNTPRNPGKKQPYQTISMKPENTGDGILEERIRSGAYHYVIIPKPGWRDWIKPKVMWYKWDGLLIYKTDDVMVSLISYNF